MRRIFNLSLLALVMFIAMPTMAKTKVPYNKLSTKNIMRRVADWQITSFTNKQEHHDLDWTNATLYRGMIDWAEMSERLDGYDGYYKWLMRIGARNHYQLAKSMYHADDIAVGQAFLDLYVKYKNERMLWPVQARTNWVVAHPAKCPMLINYSNINTLDRWTWCDALFMAPPVYARMYAITGDKKYLDFMDSEYRNTYNYLYDKDEHLFFRDGRYFDQREANGKKVFWGRGNGWVLGGLVDLLKLIPQKNSIRPFYEKLFKEMCARIIETQSADGYWHASLLDPASYPSPETSSTGFIVYALAYGINAGYLDRDTYLPAVIKGWDAMLKAVDGQGKLCYVQPIGADPKKVTRSMTEVYGVGAFLLAGCQIYELCEK